MSAVDVVGIIVILFLVIAFWNVAVRIYQLCATLMPIVASIMLYRALAAEHIGIYEAEMVGAGVIACILCTVLGVVGRFVQACADGYEGLGLGDYIHDTCIAAMISVVAPVVAFILRLVNASGRSASAEPFQIFFVKGAILCTMITMYGWILIIIKARMTHGADGLFDSQPTPYCDPYGDPSDEVLEWHRMRREWEREQELLDEANRMETYNNPYDGYKHF